MTTLNVLRYTAVLLLIAVAVACENPTNSGSATATMDASSKAGGKHGAIASSMVRSLPQSILVYITSGPQSGQQINLSTYEIDMDVNPADTVGNSLAPGSSFTITAVRVHGSGAPGPYSVPAQANLQGWLTFDRLEDGPSKK